MFQVGGRRILITKIYKMILHGNCLRLQKFLAEENLGIVLEVACALRTYLLNLRTPLIPEHIQAIVLGKPISPSFLSVQP